MNASADLLIVGVKMVAALGTVLALIVVLLYGLRRISGQRLGNARTKRIEVIESHYMGMKKTISLVRVPGRVLVLGIAGDRINLLDRLDDDLADASITDDAPMPFGSLLSGQLKKLGNGLKGKDDQ
jgi:flagellar biosynthetic protein FliO